MTQFTSGITGYLIDRFERDRTFADLEAKFRVGDCWRLFTSELSFTPKLSLPASKYLTLSSWQTAHEGHQVLARDYQPKGLRLVLPVLMLFAKRHQRDSGVQGSNGLRYFLNNNGAHFGTAVNTTFRETFLDLRHSRTHSILP